MISDKKEGVCVDIRKNVVHNFDPEASHEDAVTIDGLEDLFNWASEMVTDANDPRTRRIKEQRLRRNVLELIQHAKAIEAREKVADEVAYLQRRVIALLQTVADKMEEADTLRQIVVTQYFALAQLAKLSDEVKQLQSLTWYREEAEAERKDLMNALSKLKKERDFLDELLTVVEQENCRLAKNYNETRDELAKLRNRRWWHRIAQLFRQFANAAAAT
jgi:septal ring factor EnvC (AmiA/AmiB activator)